jgi:hypothetical protein
VARVGVGDRAPQVSLLADRDLAVARSYSRTGVNYQGVEDLERAVATLG